MHNCFNSNLEAGVKIGNGYNAGRIRAIMMFFAPTVIISRKERNDICSSWKKSVIDKFLAKRLNLKGDHSINFVGRTLTHIVIVALSSGCMQMVLLPKGTCNQLETIQRDFV